MIDEELLGSIGFGLTGCLWLLSSWRLIYHTLIKRQQTPDPNHYQLQQPQTPRSFSKWLTRRRTFHCLLWMATSCEALAYADLSRILPFRIQNRIFAEKLGYILLDVGGRGVLEFLAFCTVTALWLDTAIQSSPSWGSGSSRHYNMPWGLLPSIFLVVVVLLVVSSASLSVAALVLFPQDGLETMQKLTLTQAQTILEAFAWGVHSLVVLECLIVTSKRIFSLVPATQWISRISLLSKAVLPMIVTSLAYALRSIWLLAVYRHVSKMGRDTWAWWIGFMWCPSWLAVGVLLYSARKRDHLAHDELHQPLLPPPAEAFLAFSQHRLGIEVDDSFCCCSPIPHVLAPREDIEVCDEETLSTDSEPARQPPVPS